MSSLLMLSLLDAVLWATKIGVLGLVAYGGIVAAVVIYFGTLKWPLPQALRASLSVLCLLASAYSFGNMDGLDRTKDELRNLKTQLAVNERALTEAQRKAQERAEVAAKLEETISDYEKRLADNPGDRCPPDPSYSRSLRNILNSAGGS